MADYATRTERSVQLSGCKYMLDDQDSRIGELRSLAAKQCNYPDEGTLASMSVRGQVFSCLPQGCLARYDEYMLERPEKVSIGEDFGLPSGPQLRADGPEW